MNRVRHCVGDRIWRTIVALSSTLGTNSVWGIVLRSLQPKPNQASARRGADRMTAQPGRVLRYFHLLAAAALFMHAGIALGQKMPESTKGPSVAPTVVLGNPSDYAGIERCRSCHKPEYREYQKT